MGIQVASMDTDVVLAGGVESFNAPELGHSVAQSLQNLLPDKFSSVETGALANAAARLQSAPASQIAGGHNVSGDVAPNTSPTKGGGSQGRA